MPYCIPLSQLFCTIPAGIRSRSSYPNKCQEKLYIISNHYVGYIYHKRYKIILIEKLRFLKHIGTNFCLSPPVEPGVLFIMCPNAQSSQEVIKTSANYYSFMCTVYCSNLQEPLNALGPFCPRCCRSTE